MMKAGKHTVEYVYRPNGIIAGAFITFVSLAGFAGYEIIRHKKKIKSYKSC